MAFLCAGAETSAFPLLVMLGRTNTARELPGLPVLPRLVEVLRLAATHSSSLIVTPGFTAQHRHFLPSTRLEVSSLARQLSPLVFQPAGFSVISFPPRQTASAGSILPKLIGFQKARSYANCRRGAFWIRQRKSPDSLSLDHSPVFDTHLHFSHLPRVSAPPGQACRVSSRSRTGPSCTFDPCLSVNRARCSFLPLFFSPAVIWTIQI